MLQHREMVFTKLSIGLRVECTKKTRTKFTESLSKWSSSQGYCIEAKNGIKVSCLMSLDQQAEVGYREVREMKQSRDGSDTVEISQVTSGTYQILFRSPRKEYSSTCRGKE